MLPPVQYLGASTALCTNDTGKRVGWANMLTHEAAPFHANLARITVGDVLDAELEVARHNGCDLVKVSSDLLGTLERLQIDHVVICITTGLSVSARTT